MSILIGVGIVGTITVFYLGSKGWQALHKAVGITPGVLIYQDPKAPLLLNDMSWQQLKLDKRHLQVLPEQQLRQLQRIDNKVANYHHYQQDVQKQNITPARSESQFVLHKLLHTRLPEMLASYYYVITANVSSTAMSHKRQVEAKALLQEALNTIENRLDDLLEGVESQHLQDLKVMKKYIDSQSKP